jgi:hypothetical protein|nr:MAG TPA: minor structural protein [Caudoviricetes sp.]
MDFLKSILGDDLFSQVENKVNAYNSDEANKDKQIKIANLASGEYTSKNKFTDLETEKENIASQLSAANKVIEDLRKATKTDEDLQKKVTAYESKIQTLNEELKVTKTENALKFALAQAGAVDVDYLAFKVKQKGELELDENGKIKGIDDTIKDLKTQFSQQFTSSKENKIDEKKLPDEDGGDKGMTKKELLAKPYAERNKIYQEDPEKFNEIMKS